MFQSDLTLTSYQLLEDIECPSELIDVDDDITFTQCIFHTYFTIEDIFFYRKYTIFYIYFTILLNILS